MNTSSHRLLSFIAGAGTLAALLSLLGMMSPSPAAEGKGRFLVELTPQPRDLVRVLEGDSYVVPPGRILVIKTLTTAQGGGGSVLKIDGQSVLAHDFGSDLKEYALGVVAKAGQTVTLDDQFPDANSTPVALGYLADM